MTKKWTEKALLENVEMIRQEYKPGHHTASLVIMVADYMVKLQNQLCDLEEKSNNN